MGEKNWWRINSEPNKHKTLHDRNANTQNIGAVKKKIRYREKANRTTGKSLGKVTDIHCLHNIHWLSGHLC